MKRLLACVVLALSSPLMADTADEKALQAYEEGLKAERENDLHRAIDSYKKALRLRGQDGPIVFPGPSTIVWEDGPRGKEKKTVQSPGRSERYEPRARMAAVQSELDRVANDKDRKQKFANPPEVVVSVQLADASNDRALDGGESGKLIITLTNEGRSPADEIVLTLVASDDAVRLPGTIAIGTLEPGQSLIRPVSFDVERSVREGSVRFAISARERDGFAPAAVNLTAMTRAYQKPDLMVSRPSVARSAGNPNLLNVSYEITNTGRGTAHDVRSRLRLDDRVILEDESFNDKLVGTLRPGETARVQFGVYTNIAAGAPLPITVFLKENVVEANATLALNVPAGGAMGRSGSTVIVQNRPGSTAAVANVGINIPVGVGTEPNAVGLIIGNANYEQLDRVAFAQSDAKVVYDYVVKTMGYTDEANMKLELDLKARDFKRIFGTPAKGFKDGWLYGRVELNSRRRSNPPVFVYYSGHGAPSMGSETKSYLVPVDLTLRDLELDGYPLDDFYASIAALPSDNVTVVVDSCFSGSSSAGLLQKDISPAMLKTSSSITPSQAGTASIFTSTAPGQVSYWFEEGQHSLFTYYFLKGLRGDADENKDAQLTATELHRYLSFEVESYILNAERPSRQTPQLVGNDSRVMVRYGGR